MKRYILLINFCFIVSAFSTCTKDVQGFVFHTNEITESQLATKMSTTNCTLDHIKIQPELLSQISKISGENLEPKDVVELKDSSQKFSMKYLFLENKKSKKIENVFAYHRKGTYGDFEKYKETMTESNNRLFFEIIDRQMRKFNILNEMDA